MLRHEIDPERLTQIKDALAPAYRALFDEPTFLRYISAKEFSWEDLTMETYQNCVPKVSEFFSYTNKTATELFQMGSTVDGILQTKEIMQNWYLHLTSKNRKPKKLDPATAVKNLAAVNNFYRMLGLRLDFVYPHIKTKRTFKPNAEFLLKALEYVKDPKLRSYVFLGKELGLTWADLSRVDVNADFEDPSGIVHQSIRKQISKGKVPVFVCGERRKSGVGYAGFIGEEAFKNLQIYGNRLIGYSSDDQLEDDFKPIAREMDQPKFTPVALRKFLTNGIRQNITLNEKIAKVLSGHQIDDIEKFYVEFPESVLTEAWNFCYDKIRILPKGS